MNKNQFDIIIIGAGVIGSAIARFLSQYKLKILIIEKEYDIGTGPSSANSGIIHSGHDPIPNSLKAKMNTKGNKMWHSLAKDLNIPFKQTGSYVVAIGPEEFWSVRRLYERAIENCIPGIKILNKEEILYKEPKISSKVTGALWTETTGIIDPFEAVVGLCENAVVNGVKLLLNTEFNDFIIENKKKIIGVKTNRGEYYSRWVINSAGLSSDMVMHKAGIRSDFNIIPTRGEYFIFDSSKISLNTVLYPVPTEKGKGTLVTTTTHGNVMIGPNAEKLEDKSDSSTTKDGLELIVENAKKLIPSLNTRDVIAQFAGIRPKGNSKEKDFIIEIPKELEGFVNLGGIESPGLASAPAIAEYVIELLKDSGEVFTPKAKWNPIREARPRFKKISHKERKALVEKNPAYGRIVCRCEEISEGEIIDAIHSPVPALTYDAIKRRTWTGTGRCQGGFDYPRVIEILSRELKKSKLKITKKGEGSNFLFRETKG